MNNGYIAVLDSGVGGLSVLSMLVKELPCERYLYFGDNQNAPYGNRTKTDLWFITMKNLDCILKYNVKAIIVACNTLSVTLLNNIREYTNVPCYGVFPPVEQAEMCSGRVLLLSTVKTAEEYKNRFIDKVGFPDLVRDIENHLFSLDKLNFGGHFKGKKTNYSTVILGCTHYFFIKNQIIDHFQPQNLISGNELTVRRLKEDLTKTKSLGNYNGFDVFFIGKNSLINKKFWNLVVNNAVF